MTDKEKLSQLFKEVGVPFTEGFAYISIEVGGDKVTGKEFGSTWFNFNDNGKLLQVEISE